MWIRLNDIMIESSVVVEMRRNGFSVEITKKNGNRHFETFDDEESARAAFDTAFKELRQENILEQEERKREQMRFESVRKYISDTRTLNVLERIGCYTLGDLETISEAELVKNRGVGVHVLRTVRDTLGIVGLKMNTQKN